jgi:hypothetical protein
LRVARAPGRVAQDQVVVDVGGVAVAVEPVRVPRLVVAAGAALGTVVQDPVDQPQVAVQQVQLDPPDPGPGTAVDPGAPVAEPDHLGGVAVVQLGGQGGQLGDRERLGRVVVDGQVDVGVLVAPAAPQRPAEGHRHHPVQGPDPARDLPGQLDGHAGGSGRTVTLTRWTALLL